MKTNICIITLAALAAAGTASAQQPAGRTTALSHAIHAVEDLDTTLAFYRDVFGIEGRAQAFPNPAVPLLTNAPGVSLELSMVGLPGGLRFELTQFTGVERQAAQAQYTDPGAGSLVLRVSDLDGLLAAAKRAGAPVVTRGGKPVEISVGGRLVRSIVLRDPDGFFLQLVEDAAPADAAEGSLHGVSLAYTMEDAAATRRFYTGMMGIELAGSAGFERDPAFARLIGAPDDVEFRRLNGTLPPDAAVVFTEFRGVPRTKFDPRVRDPGAPAMAIQVSNIAGMVEQMRHEGVNMISADGKLVDFGNGVRNIFVDDPNGLNIELFERPAAPPAR
jgi:catechol 2,3-dioxygenase-like lactoylglutathione lyase family enzyme